MVPMAIRELRVAGYRSIRDLRLPLKDINVLVGPNGCGKSNLYRSMYLLAQAVHGRLARTLADEGGMPSVLWAGQRTKGPRHMTLGVRLDDCAYEMVCGLIAVSSLTPRSAFKLDPEVKRETLHLMGPRDRRIPFLERGEGAAWLRDLDGNRVSYPLTLSTSESVLSQLREPHRYPELSVLRQTMQGWRFYHQFRTDAEAPVRQPEIGVRTPVLGHDGRDLAAALQTIREVGDADALEAAVDWAFPGAGLVIDIEPERARFCVALSMPGIRRPFDARELSDGTLRYLCLLAALLSPRPPDLMALNEPETSIHPDLVAPLARLIADAGKRSQLWITTHSRALADCIAEHAASDPIELEMVGGATRVVE